MIPDISYINIYSPTIFAYRIVSYINGNNHFIIDETYACLIMDGVVKEKWAVLNMSYDSNGGEIITKEGDTIYLSKEILIKRGSGEEVSLEYKPIDVDQIAIIVRIS